MKSTFIVIAVFVLVNADECELKNYPASLVCTNDTVCANDKDAPSDTVCNAAVPLLSRFVGPVYREGNVCSCDDSGIGPFCQLFAPTGCKSHCLNGADVKWNSPNKYTGCDCKNTGFWGWYCEKPNNLLCKFVDESKSRFHLEVLILSKAFSRRILDDEPRS